VGETTLKVVQEIFQTVREDSAGRASPDDGGVCQDVLTWGTHYALHLCLFPLLQCETVTDAVTAPD